MFDFEGITENEQPVWVAFFVVTVHSYILVGRFRACMKICLHECRSGAPFHEQCVCKTYLKQRRALKARFCEWSGVNSNFFCYESAMKLSIKKALLMARMNCNAN